MRHFHQGSADGGVIEKAWHRGLDRVDLCRQQPIRKLLSRQIGEVFSYRQGALAKSIRKGAEREIANESTDFLATRTKEQSGCGTDGTLIRYSSCRPMDQEVGEWLPD